MVYIGFKWFKANLQITVVCPNKEKCRPEKHLLSYNSVFKGNWCKLKDKNRLQFGNLAFLL